MSAAERASGLAAIAADRPALGGNLHIAFLGEAAEFLGLIDDSGLLADVAGPVRWSRLSDECHDLIDAAHGWADDADLRFDRLLWGASDLAHQRADLTPADVVFVLREAMAFLDID